MLITSIDSKGLNHVHESSNLCHYIDATSLFTSNVMCWSPLKRASSLMPF